MLWVKVGIIATAAIMATTLSIYKTGKVASLSEENGIQAQALVQKDQAIAQTRQLLEQEAADKLRVEAEHEKALQALSEREKAHQVSLERANNLLNKVRELSDENEELRYWRDNDLPDGVGGLLNAAARGDTARADSGHQDSLPDPSR